MALTKEEHNAKLEVVLQHIDRLADQHGICPDAVSDVFTVVHQGIILLAEEKRSDAMVRATLSRAVERIADQYGIPLADLGKLYENVLAAVRADNDVEPWAH